MSSDFHERETRRGLIRAALRVLIKGVLVLLLVGAIVAVLSYIGCQANVDCSDRLGLGPQGAAEVSTRAGATWTVLTWMGYILGGALFLALLSIPLLIAGGAIGGALYALALGFAKWQEARNHAIDKRGFHGMKEIQTLPWYVRILGFGSVTLLDMDRVKTGIVQVMWTPWGKLFATGSTAGASDEEQMEMNRLNNRVRRDAAKASGQRSPKAAGKWEVLDDNDLLPYTLPKAGQQALGLGGPVIDGQAQPALPAPTSVDFARVAPLLTDEALFLGWSPGAAGKLRLATWLTYSRSALGILGGMRQGKTQLGLGLAAQMLKLGWQVVTLDPEKERSWKALALYGAEWHQTDPDRIVGQLECVYAEWERRGELLDVYGVGDVQDLAERVRPPHFALFLEELGVMRNRLDREERVRFDHILSDLIQVGGKRLMRVVVVDHHYKSYTGEWPEMLRKQAIKLTFRQEQADKSLVGYYPLNTLGVGEFAYEGERWRSWQIAADLTGFLGGPQPPRFRPLIDDAPPLALPMGDPAPAEAPPQVSLDPDAETDLQTKAQLWIAREVLAGRTARQADLMRYLDVTKSYAHRLWNSYHPGGGNANWPYLGNPYLDATTDATWGELAGEPVQYDLSDEGERQRFLGEVNWDDVQFPSGKGDKP